MHRSKIGLLTSESGHKPKSPFGPLCQLLPETADMTLHRPSPLCAITGREQVQQYARTETDRISCVRNDLQFFHFEIASMRRSGTSQRSATAI